MASMHEVDTWSSDPTICRWIASVPIETGEQKKSCDAISKRHGDVMPSSCHSEKMLWNPSIDGDTPPTLTL